MATRAHFGFDFERIGALQISVTDSGGTSPISLSTGTHAHISLASGIAGWTEFADAFETVLNADGTLNGTYTVTYSTALNEITLACDESYSASTLNGTAQRVLGNSNTSISSTTSWTSDIECYYSIRCSLARRAHDSDQYEAADVAKDAVAGKESHYGIAYDDVAIHRDFSVAHEPVAIVFKGDAVATVPWAWQHAFEHARNLMPFAFVDDLGTTYHYLRAEGASFGKGTRTAVQPGYRGHWDIRLMTRQMGT